MDKFYIVYVTTNNLNSKIYIGSHACYSLDDGYLGSGKVLKQAIRKYGRHNFSRYVIEQLESIEDARELEALLVQEAIEKLGRQCYNRSWSGTGASLGKDNAFFGKTHTAETRRRLSQVAKTRVAEANHFYGRSHSPDSIERMKAAKKAHPVDARVLSLVQSKWLWHTPAGVFFSCYDAAAANDLGVNCIKNWCKNSDKLVSPNYQIPESYWNRTWRENGFYRQRHGED